MNYNNFRVLSCSTCNKKYGLHESEKLADEFILRLKQCSCGSKGRIYQLTPITEE